MSALLLASVAMSGTGASAPEPVNPYTGQDVVFWVGGQSNVIGRYGPIDPVLDATDPNILMYAEGTDSIVTAADPLDHFNENPDNIGYGLSFAKRFMVLNAPARIILICMGQGGSGFMNEQWNPSDGTIYHNAKTRWQAGMARIKATYNNVMVGGILWTQGEDEVLDFPTFFDGADDDARFRAMPAGMLHTVRTVWPDMLPTVPILLTSIPSGASLTGAANTNVQAGLSAIPSMLAHTAHIDGTDLATGDGLHWTAASLRTMGERIADGHAGAQADSAGFAAPTGFTPDASAVETAFALDAASMSDLSPVVLTAGSYPEFTNERVRVSNGLFDFDGNAELRWSAPAGKPHLQDRDWVLKVRCDHTSTGEAGIIGDYTTTGNNRSWLLRYLSGNLQFYGSHNGSTATQMIAAPWDRSMSDIEIRRVGTAISMLIDDVSVGSYTLSAGYTFFQNDVASPLMVGEFVGGRNLVGSLERVSLEFLS